MKGGENMDLESIIKSKSIEMAKNHISNHGVKITCPNCHESFNNKSIDIAECPKCHSKFHVNIKFDN